jgi:hypothetical protein
MMKYFESKEVLTGDVVAVKRQGGLGILVEHYSRQISHGLKYV